MEKNLYMKISQRLCELRQEKHWTQEELANKLNIDKRKVARWETGVSLPEIELFIELSNLYNTSIDYLACKTNKKTIFKLFQR